jgi:hypothetical protein
VQVEWSFRHILQSLRNACAEIDGHKIAPSFFTQDQLLLSLISSHFLLFESEDTCCTNSVVETTKNSLLSYHYISMQGLSTTPTEDDFAFVPTEHHVRNGTNLNRTFTVRRKAAKRTFPWDLSADEVQLALPRPQDEDTRETKRPRLEEPFSTSTNEATTTQNTSHSTAVALTPDADAANLADSDPVMDINSNVRATGALICWTPEEDTKLTRATTNITRTKHGKDFMIDSATVTVLVPGKVLPSSIDPTLARAGLWTTDEDTKLTDAVNISVSIFRSKNWLAISALVPGRTNIQCRGRWDGSLAAQISQAKVDAGQWTADEDKELRDAVGAHGTKNWKKVATLVPSRTEVQCHNRWCGTSVSNGGTKTARAGHWTAHEDKMLKDAIATHGDKNWEKIATQIPGRTKAQCRCRWCDNLVSNIEPTTAPTCKWPPDEDRKLADVVRAHGGKNWRAIAALMPGRTVNQCRGRTWYLGSRHRCRLDDGSPTL